MKDSVKYKNSLKFEDIALARMQQGLLPAPVLQLTVDRFSNCSTKSQLVQFRKHSNHQLCINTDIYSHQGPEARLKEREKQYNLTPPPGKTYHDIKQSAKKRDTEHLTGTFGNQRLGIHGEELPKFEKNIEVFLSKNSFKNDFPLKYEPIISEKYIKKLNFNISEPPNKIDFSPDNYRTKSQYLRVRDKNVGAIKRSNFFKNLQNNMENFKIKRKAVILFSKKRSSSRAIRSRGFVI